MGDLLNRKKINSLKVKFERERRKIRTDFFKNIDGTSTCKKNSNLIDKLIRDFYEVLEKNYGIEKKFIICAVGGYGRRHVSPYSDIDLLFVYDESYELRLIKKFVEFILYPLWDLGYKIGYAVRNFKQVGEFSKKDHVIKTSMIDARIISGSSYVYKKIIVEYEEEIIKTSSKFLQQKIKERKKKISEFDDNFIKNEPNIKESNGSLRDINLIFWGLKIFKIVRKKFDTKEKSFFKQSEKRKVMYALDFLLTIRCFIHYFSERQNDKLSFDSQRMIAEKLYLKEKTFNINKKVELLMKNYFFQIRVIKNLTKIITNILENRIKEKSILNNFLEKKIDIKKKSFVEKFLKDLSIGKDNINHQRVILDKINVIPARNFITSKNIKVFKNILFSESKIEKLIILNDLGILAKIIPEFSNIVFQTQFDHYHSLTVDQHTLKALSILKSIKNNKTKKKYYEFPRKVFNNSFDKKPLFYATLLHDIGKGLDGDHHLKGANLARKIILRFKENKIIANETSWLVKHHLLMSEYAFKKDLEDYSVIKNFSKSVKDLKRLKSLFLLTVADISAVDHGLWNDWKSILLKQLYIKCEREILKPEKIKTLNDKIKNVKDKVISLSKNLSKHNLDSFSKITYPNFWLLQSPKVISFQIENFFNGSKKYKEFNFFIKKNGKKKFLEIFIVTNDKPRLFLNLISIFVLEEISVYEARIFTLDDGTVIDTFKVSLNRDDFLTKKEIDEKILKLEKKLFLLSNNGDFKIKEPVLQKRDLLKKLEVYIDNNSSATYTVLVVIANNRPMLLYDISKILIKNGLIISMAKISTNGDFIEDSFHLRNKFGFKLRDEDYIHDLIVEIKTCLSKELSDVF